MHRLIADGGAGSGKTVQESLAAFFRVTGD
jgi:hypothetical protein